MNGRGKVSSQILTTGLTGASFKTVLRHGFKNAKPTVLGFAVAYVSVPGFHFIQKLVDTFEVKQFRLVTDTSDGVTHPTALAAALAYGWAVRVVDDLPGTFHPKFYVGGAAFKNDCGIFKTSFILASSGNLSAAALSRNGECSYLHVGTNLAVSAGRAWKECWEAGSPLTAPKLAAYAKFFALRNRNRKPADLVTLGVANEIISSTKGKPPKDAKPPPKEQKTIPATLATTVWVGLESFTGDYDLQVEFPRDAGEVASHILTSMFPNENVSLLCEDGQPRQFIFRYYANNGMWRLNVPNTTPGAAWAREHKLGIAILQVTEDEAAITFQILKPGDDLSDVVDRSLALGTWGHTSKRLYGWY